MTQPPSPHCQELGQLTIFVSLGQRRAKGLLERAFGRPIYQLIVDEAKKDGLCSAVAYHTHYGFSNRGRIESPHVEFTNDELTVRVELIANRDDLEAFCRKHAELLRGKQIFYQRVESWTLNQLG